MANNTIWRYRNMTKSNENIIGKTFASWKGLEATYIDTRRVPEGFRILCESTPHHACDHIVYGRRSDGQYIGIGQPYPMGADRIHDIHEYCKAVGLEATITGGSTWNPDACFRILFQRDDDNIERFNIAVNCSRWHGNYPVQGETQKIIDGVNRRLSERTDDSRWRQVT